MVQLEDKFYKTLIGANLHNQQAVLLRHKVGGAGAQHVAVGTGFARRQPYANGLTIVGGALHVPTGCAGGRAAGRA